MKNNTSDINIEFSDYVKTFDIGEKEGVNNEVNIRNQIAFKAFKIAINKTLSDINEILGDLTGRESEIIPMQVAYKIRQELDTGNIKDIENNIKESLGITLGYDENGNYGYNNQKVA